MHLINECHKNEQSRKWELHNKLVYIFNNNLNFCSFQKKKLEFCWAIVSSQFEVIQDTCEWLLIYNNSKYKRYKKELFLSKTLKLDPQLPNPTKDTCCCIFPANFGSSDIIGNNKYKASENCKRWKFPPKICKANSSMPPFSLSLKHAEIE